MTLSRRLTSAVALLCVTGVLAACGDDEEEDSGGGGAAPAATESGGGGAALDVAAEEPSGGYAFAPSELTAEAGPVTITLDNPGSNQAPHAVEIEGQGVEEVSETISPGATAEVTADLEPGEYRFYCPVGDHAAQGMEGTLTVN